MNTTTPNIINCVLNSVAILPASPAKWAVEFTDLLGSKWQGHFVNSREEAVGWAQWYRNEAKMVSRGTRLSSVCVVLL